MKGVEEVYGSISPDKGKSDHPEPLLAFPFTPLSESS